MWIGVHAWLVQVSAEHGLQAKFGQQAQHLEVKPTRSPLPQKPPQ